MNAEQKKILKFVEKCEYAAEFSDIRREFDDIKVSNFRDLLVQGYISEHPRVRPHTVNGEMTNDEHFHVYRLTEKGRSKMAGGMYWVWYQLSSNPALWVGVASIIFGVLSLALSTINLYKSAEIAKENLYVQSIENRPYLYFGESGIDIGQEKSTTTLYFSINNSGRLPALNTKLEFDDGNYTYKSEWTIGGVIVSPGGEIEGNVVLNENIVDRYTDLEVDVRLLYSDPLGNEYCTQARGELSSKGDDLILPITESFECNAESFKESSQNDYSNNLIEFSIELFNK